MYFNPLASSIIKTSCVSGASPFHWAIDGGHANVIEKILDETDSVSQTVHFALICWPRFRFITMASLA